MKNADHNVFMNILSQSVDNELITCFKTQWVKVNKTAKDKQRGNLTNYCL